MARWAVVVGFIAVALIIAVTCIVWTRQKNRQENIKAGRAMRGDLNQKQERQLMDQLDQGNDLLALMLDSRDFDGSILTEQHRGLAEQWQAEYIRLNRMIGWVRHR